jgi:hypothetical protein
MTVVVFAGLAVLGAGLAIRYAFVTSPDQAAVNAAPRIRDAGFERAASGVCKQYVQVFNTETTLGHFPTKDQRGDFVESIARSFDQMVAGLRALPVAAADQAAVEQWLADWDGYDAYGHQYAAAIRAGAERDLVTRDTKRIDALQRRRNGFARANHMAACAFS